MIRYIYDDGWRLMVVYKVGRKWAHALDVGELRALKLAAAELAGTNDAPGVPPRRLARRLKRRARERRRLGVGFSFGAVRQAIAALEKAAGAG